MHILCIGNNGSQLHHSRKFCIWNFQPRWNFRLWCDYFPFIELLAVKIRHNNIFISIFFPVFPQNFLKIYSLFLKKTKKNVILIISGKIGISLTAFSFVPKTDSEEDKKAADRAFSFEVSYKLLIFEGSQVCFWLHTYSISKSGKIKKNFRLGV